MYVCFEVILVTVWVMWCECLGMSEIEDQTHCFIITETKLNTIICLLNITLHVEFVIENATLILTYTSWILENNLKDN